MVMDDESIVTLYWERSENAIKETERKYGKYCHTISYGILRDFQDSEECVNEAYLRTWNAIPPARPVMLSTFLGKITRNLALNYYEKRKAEKRGGGQVALAWSELEECFDGNNDLSDTLERETESVLIVKVLNDFLGGLKKKHRMVFVSRYWYLNSIEKVAGDCGLSVSNAKQILFRTREKLKAKFEKEGISL
jgi:RNA polymerase sigma-70 factor (ECF subfamily)